MGYREGAKDCCEQITEEKPLAETRHQISEHREEGRGVQRREGTTASGFILVPELALAAVTTDRCAWLPASKKSLLFLWERLGTFSVPEMG